MRAAQTSMDGAPGRHRIRCGLSWIFGLDCNAEKKMILCTGLRASKQGCLEGGAADLVEDGFVADFGKVSALNLGRDTYERLPESIFGGSENHLLLDLGIIRRPGVEADLVPLALVALLVLEVVNGVTAFGGRKLGDKVVVRRRIRLVLDNDLGESVVEGEDDVLGLLSELELLELRKAVLRDLDTRGL